MTNNVCSYVAQIKIVIKECLYKGYYKATVECTVMFES